VTTQFHELEMLNMLVEEFGRNSKWFRSYAAPSVTTTPLNRE